MGGHIFSETSVISVFVFEQCKLLDFGPGQFTKIKDSVHSKLARVKGQHFVPSQQCGPAFFF